MTDHFPTNTIKLTLSGDVPTVRLSKFLPTLPETHSVAIFIGAMARGSVSALLPWPRPAWVLIVRWLSRREDNFADGVIDQKVSISEYSLSASVACGKFCCAMVRRLLARV